MRSRGDRLTALGILTSAFIATANCTNAAEGTPWPFWIVKHSSTWTRPTPDVQAEVWKDNRFGKVMEWYERRFILLPDGTNVPGYLEILAGLLNTQYGPRYEVEAEPEREALHLGRYEIADEDALRGISNGAVFVGVDVLYYHVISMERKDSTLKIIVEPRERGFESILFPWPRAEGAIAMQFRTPDDHVQWEATLGLIHFGEPPADREDHDKKARPPLDQFAYGEAWIGDFHPTKPAAYPFLACMERDLGEADKGLPDWDDVTGKATLRNLEIDIGPSWKAGTAEAVESGAMIGLILRRQRLLRPVFVSRGDEIVLELQIESAPNRMQVVVIFRPLGLRRYILTY